MEFDKPENFGCVAAAEHLHEYLDGELPPELRAAMERHLVSCADCATTLAQLRQIEAAHQQLDARLELPEEKYWHVLPQRVMEKLKAAEKRRLLVLPKLPRLKSPAKPETTPKQDFLYLTPAIQKFLRGPAKYVLPLAAVAAFCFFMIGELRDKSEAPIMTAAAPEQPQVEAQSAPEASALGKANVAEPARMAEAPAPKPAPGTGRAFQRADEKIISLRDTLLAGAGQATGVGAVATIAGGESKTDEPRPTTLAVAQPPAAELDIAAPEVKQAQAFAEAVSKAKDQPAAPLEKEISYRAESLKTETAKIADAQLAQSAESRAKKVSPAGRMGVSSSAMRSTENIETSRYRQTLQRVQQISDLKKREKLWRDFLKSNPDSLSRALATADLGRTLAAASDSTTKPEQLEKNIAFYREQAITLRAQMGAAEYDREFVRLQMLLNFRKTK